MKKIIVLLTLFGCLSAADYDIQSVSINPNGWTANLTFTAMDSGGTYNFGFSQFRNPADARAKMIVRRLGFDDTAKQITVDDTIYIDTVLTKVYPNTTADSEVVSGSDVVITMHLSHPIFLKDTIKSVDILSGLYTVSGHASNAYTASSATNNSIENYTRVTGNWLSVDRQKWKDTIRLMFDAAHLSARAGRLIRGVKFTVRDAHDNIYTKYVSAISEHGHVVTGFSSQCYFGNIPTDIFTDGDTVTCHAFAYGFYGDSASILNTDDGVNSYPGPLYTRQVHVINKNLIYSVCACVDSTGGNDASGVAFDTTANADTAHCFINIAAAANAISARNNSVYSHNDVGGGTIFAKAGNYIFSGGTVSPTTEPNTWITIKPYPGVSRGQVNIVNKSGTNNIAGMTKLENITIANNVSTIFSSCKYFWVDRCSLNVTGIGPFYILNNVWMTDNTIVNCDNIPYSTQNVSVILWRGNSWKVGASNKTISPYTMVGNKLKSSDNGTYYILPQFYYSGQTIPIIKNGYIKDNFMSMNASLSYGPDSILSTTHGFTFIQNVLESRSETSPIFKLMGDGSRADSIKNTIFLHNTIVGQRLNFMYNDPTTMTDASYPKIRKLNAFKNNIINGFNVVSGASNESHSGTQTNWQNGNWYDKWGTNSSGNVFGALAYPPDGRGLKNNDTTISSTNYSTFRFNFVDNASYVGTNTGNGNYALTDSSGYVKTAAYEKLLSYDIVGNARSTGGAAGAYEFGEECTPPTISAGADRIDTAQVTDTVTMALGGGTTDSVTGVSLPAWMTLTKTGANMGRLILAPTDSVDPADYIFIAHGCANDTDTIHVTVTWGDVRLTSVAPDTVWWGDTATILGRGFKNAQGTSTFAWGDSTPTMALWKNDTLKAICPQLTAGFYTFSACNGTMCDTLTTDSIYVAGPRITQYTFTLSDDGHGSTVPATGDTTVDSGSVIAVSATPDAGYVFSHWMDTGAVTYGVDSLTVTVSGNVLLTAVFAVKQFTLIMNANVHSTTIPPNGDTLVDSGGVVTISCTPDAGYTFTGWEIVSGELDLGLDSTTVVVNGDGTLKARLFDTSNFYIASDTTISATKITDTAIWQSNGLTVTLAQGVTWTVAVMSGIGGTTEAPDTLQGAGAGATYTGPQDTLSNTRVALLTCTNPLYLDSSANTSGNNVNVKSLSYTGATLSSASGLPGDTIGISTGNGLVGGAASIGDSAVTLTVVNSDSGYIVVPLAMPAGSYDVGLSNSDGDTLTLAGGLSVTSSGSSRRSGRGWLGLGVWIRP